MVEQKVFDIFEELNRGQMRYCLLRGYDELATAARKRELDLLLAPDQLADFARLVSQQGYVALPPWGYAPHHFFVAYDEATDVWTKLDVVTEIRYGSPIRNLATDLMERCLSDRCSNEVTFTLSPAEEFVTLLLHCILDKGAFRAEHQARLKALRREAANSCEIEEKISYYVERYLNSPIAWSLIALAIDNEDWQWLLSLRQALGQYFFWQQPVKSVLRLLSCRILRSLRPLLISLRRHGLAVALLAPDGAGKTTLSKNLACEDYIKARLIYMGGNSDSNTVGLPTTKWLKKKAKAINQQKLSIQKVIFKCLSYGNRLIEQWYRYGVGYYHKRLGRFVIFDRYVYDSYLAASTKSIGKRLRRWFLRSSCPAPDLVILLDAPGSVLFNRKGEHSPAVLEKQRQVFLGLIEKIPNMTIVDASPSANAVRKKVISLIWNLYGDQFLLKDNNGRSLCTS